jgi:ABC-type sulfate transport system permease subunit
VFSGVGVALNGVLIGVVMFLFWGGNELYRAVLESHQAWLLVISWTGFLIAHAFAVSPFSLCM